MIKDQCCTIEQMNALKELGVDISKASMCRVSANIGIPATDESRLVENDVNYYGMTFPVFTVVDMLNMMPSIIRDPFKFVLRILKSNKYKCEYYSANLELSRYKESKDTLLDAVYGCLIQLGKDCKL